MQISLRTFYCYFPAPLICMHTNKFANHSQKKPTKLSYIYYAEFKSFELTKELSLHTDATGINDFFVRVLGMFITK